MTDVDRAEPLSRRLPAATRALHTRIERAGIMADFLQGRIERSRYCLLLRNLYAIYQVLDSADGTRGDARWSAFPLAELRRLPAIERDLQYLHGPSWVDLTVVPATREYVEHLERLRRDAPLLLLAHAYLRHLGDLSGGQVLRGHVARMLQLAGRDGLAFYEFGDPATVAALATRYRAALDQLDADAALASALVDEARQGFLAHERIFIELAGWVTTGAGTA